MIGIQPVVQIAGARGGPGTAGALVHDNGGSLYVLANHHVALGDGGQCADRVYAFRDRGPLGDREFAILGRVTAGTIRRVTHCNDAPFIDCALIELDGIDDFPAWLAHHIAGRWPTTFSEAAPGTRVSKAGAGTGFTRGVVVDAMYPDNPFINGRSFTATAQLLIESEDPELNFAGPGDSGAAILDEGGRVLGLLWGTNQAGQGIACPISPVLDYLGVLLVPSAMRKRSA